MCLYGSSVTKHNHHLTFIINKKYIYQKACQVLLNAEDTRKKKHLQIIPAAKENCKWVFFKNVFQFVGAALLRDTDQWWVRILNIATAVLSTQENRSSQL